MLAQPRFDRIEPQVVFCIVRVGHRFGTGSSLHCQTIDAKEPFPPEIAGFEVQSIAAWVPNAERHARQVLLKAMSQHGLSDTRFFRPQ
jgi:hypothetical protein